MALPGYKGYVPGVKCDNSTVGKTFAEETRTTLRPDKLDEKKNALATTG